MVANITAISALIKLLKKNNAEILPNLSYCFNYGILRQKQSKKKIKILLPLLHIFYQHHLHMSFTMFSQIIQHVCLITT